MDGDIVSTMHDCQKTEIRHGICSIIKLLPADGGIENKLFEDSFIHISFN